MPVDPEKPVLTEEAVRKALRQVKDPEINLNIVDLGLVYDVEVRPQDGVTVRMTLTSPGCPSGPEIISDAERAVRAIPDIGNVNVELVWEPFWTPERIEPKVRAFLGMD
jgi:metal-sulfur cluster biosynthetic enzyme